MFFKIGVLKNLANFTGKHLFWNHYLMKLQALKGCNFIKKRLKRALHYPFNWIRFLEINKLCNVIDENLTFSTNGKLISISWKVWTCSNFSTNWKWKWMNRIRHGRKNVVGKQKFELIWKVIYLYKSNQFACY